MNHEAIYLAYPNAVMVDDGAGVFDASGNKIEIDPARVSSFEPEANRIKARKEAELGRQSLYRAEADPLFFKAQRGEATMAEWNAKVEEIRNRFPYAE